MSARTNHERLVALEKQMADAAEAMDFEKAAALRNEILRVKGEAQGEDGEPLVGQPPPGAMGLGTQIPVRQPPKGWVKPKKPDFLTKNRRGDD